MTEHETLLRLQYMYDSNNSFMVGKRKEIETAMTAIKELQQYRAIGTVKDFKYLSQSEHGYDNCHNLTCRTKCKKDGYAKAIDDFAKELRRECLNSVYHEVWLHTILKIAKKLKGERV